MKSALAWTLLLLVAGMPVAFAAQSPLLAFRDLPYIIAGFAGIAALGLLLIQPVLAVDWPAWPRTIWRRRLHRLNGSLILLGVFIHVGGLYLTSPPDTLDALLLASPTAFSIYGVAAMWAMVLTALLVPLRRRIAPRQWRAAHLLLGVCIIGGTAAHALLIQGTMEPLSKAVLCAAAVLVMAPVALLRWPKRRAA